MILLHFGHLPLYAQILVIALAFGPFVLLGAAIWVRARQDAAEDAANDGTSSDKPGSGLSD